MKGRYQPLRSGVLAYYRDDEHRVVIQHRRKKVLAAPDAGRSMRGIVFRRLAIGHNLEEHDHIRVIDFEGRCEGTIWMRFFDFTWTIEEDCDLLFAIAHDTWHDERRSMPLV